ncbi:MULTISPECIES: Ni/Fe hydrogenase subunit alpha [Pseudomonadota]|jgi:NAD-reducing hydrogenase large subunit|uniref:NAD-reducing hydrogenase hoxS subunit beta n=1 Tax=Cupriavidus metallidurans (strain ATCC 43123 / DSM 2839 / NBRC 102507 / CH34) TaxID=266264 RepID=Q1LN68_CUPMC|nr:MULTISPECIES: Ni/Fe hydrogenase subunit alpha [Pseudomonadota]MBX9794386.1 Ni/Fe hydrogenase subunit alpha [Burkholderiaceae bacterium]ABF08408.1 NAD-reducing hydrogenase hoxS subunit beta [Cupriavidus metallidurans CH34]KQB57416.1 NADP oxidoreductase [Acidovorax sp. SD340]MBO1010216.1 Ni/Fe hydrogenase subunit alpha [Acidovorax sp. SD340]PWV69045.1 NAD(P)-dependent nickel-iron dehydrogenase catalytic subunit [Halomonas sp. A11-A]
MSRKLVIDPVTRIEGHGKVTVHLDDDNNVIDAKLHVVEFRGFEKFIQGHPYWEAPMFLQRICGICFVSHHLCGAKALDDMVGVGLKSGIDVTPAAEKMRRLGHYAQMLQSHTTAYFYLIVPEMLFGMDAPPEQRNVLGLIEADPELVKRVVMLRKWGQEVIKVVFGKKMHGINSVPGGVNKNLSIAERDRLLNGEEGLLAMDQVIDFAQDGLRLFYDFHEKHRAQVDSFADVPALNMSLVDADGNVDYYHGKLRIVDDDKNIVRELDYHDYLDHFSEAVEEWSYMKFPYLKDLGREKGSVRVGPLGRMNVTKTLSTPLAQEALERFHAYTKGRANNMTLHTNWARAIEILHAAEVIRELLHDPDLQKDQLVLTPPAGAWTGEGVGVVEAPRGTLLHHYRADERGNITFANLVVATTQNNQVMNRTVRSVAEDYLGGHGEITEGMMNAIEVGIRAYDPCLSCATHALGQMPLVVSVYDAAGGLIDERTR